MCTYVWESSNVGAHMRTKNGIAFGSDSREGRECTAHDDENDAPTVAVLLLFDLASAPGDLTLFLQAFQKNPFRLLLDSVRTPQNY